MNPLTGRCFSGGSVVCVVRSFSKEVVTAVSRSGEYLVIEH